jgi:hypothetical protein
LRAQLQQLGVQGNRVAEGLRGGVQHGVIIR